MKDFYDDAISAKQRQPIALVTARPFLARQLRQQLASLGYWQVSFVSPTTGETPAANSALIIAEDHHATGHVLAAAQIDPQKVFVVATPNTSTFGMRQKGEAADIIGFQCGTEELRLKLDRYFRDADQINPKLVKARRRLISKSDTARLIKTARSGDRSAFVMRLVARDGCNQSLYDFADTCRAVVGGGHPLGQWSDTELRMILRVPNFESAREIAKAVDYSITHLPKTHSDGAPIRIFLRNLRPLHTHTSNQMTDDHLLNRLRLRAAVRNDAQKLAG